ncbi:MAG: 7TM diverse intracellular signaling domain-containing protein, partial [Bacteroidales bacterium]|nr:7TM diverse intracellular signaling domain-containing protein [Bacteroidales bacterium]
MKLRKSLLAFLVTIHILISVNIEAQVINPVIKNGTLDLSNYNFEQDGNIKLNGKWKYYKSRFLSLEGIESSNNYGFVDVPKDLKGQLCANDTLGVFGFGTYCLKIIINKNDTDKSFSLKTLGIISSSKIFINDQPVGYGGTIAESEQNAVPELETHLNEFIPNTDTLYLIIQTSNYLIHSAGLFFSIEMGLEKAIVKQRINAAGQSLFIIGGIIFMMLYHFGLFIMRKKEKLTLYFALSCLVIATYSLSFNELYYTVFSAFSFEFQLILKRIALYLTITFTALFIYHSFKNEFNKNILKLIVIISLLFAIGAIVLPIKISTYFLKYFHYVAVAAALYYVFVLIKASRNKQEGALILILGMFIGFVAVVHDVLNNLQIINSVNLAPFAFFFICFTQAVFLSVKFNAAFNKNEQLLLDKTSLSKQNKEKDALIQEIHHRVKNNLQSISSIIDMQIMSLDNDSEKKTLTQTHSRITSMALVHQMLYTNNNLSSISAKSYLNQLVTTIDQMLNTKNLPIVFNLSIQDVFLGVNTCISLGMLTGEIIANAIKYAFNDTKNPKLFFNLKYNKSTSTIYYIINDNGCGLTQDVISGKKTSFGMNLIDIFSRQLEADLKIENNEGTQISVSFYLHESQ